MIALAYNRCLRVSNPRKTNPLEAAWLELEPAKALDVIVFDHIERPSEN